MAKQISISDVTLKRINLRSAQWRNNDPYDLIPHLREVNIYESIFSIYFFR